MKTRTYEIENAQIVYDHFRLDFSDIPCQGTPKSFSGFHIKGLDKAISQTSIFDSYCEGCFNRSRPELYTPLSIAAYEAGQDNRVDKDEWEQAR